MLKRMHKIQILPGSSQQLYDKLCTEQYRLLCQSLWLDSRSSERILSKFYCHLARLLTSGLHIMNFKNLLDIVLSTKVVKIQIENSPRSHHVVVSIVASQQLLCMAKKSQNKGYGVALHLATSLVVAVVEQSLVTCNFVLLLWCDVMWCKSVHSLKPIIQYVHWNHRRIIIILCLWLKLIFCVYPGYIMSELQNLHYQ